MYFFLIQIWRTTEKECYNARLGCILATEKDGRVAERFNATVLKTVVGSRPP
jgi:hypothetical protein